MKNILKSILACVLTALLIAGASWAATLIPVSQGGTGASTASGARSNLGLGTIATQNVGTLTNTKYCTYATGTGFVCNSDGIGSMTYPDAGIAVSTGSAWDTSITNNSSNWNTAYEWGNHASAGYLTSLSGAVLTDQSTPQTIGLTGTRLAKLWATDIEVTNAIAGSVTGNAATATALAADPADCAAGTVATAINASGTLTCGITPLVSGGTLTSGYHCRYDGTGLDCDRVEDASGTCAANAVCMGGHTHPTTELSGVNAGTDLTADLEEETHASEHAVSAADTVFPADPGADKYLMWDDDTGTLVWESPAGSGDVESVGDCTTGACLDGTSDGGTYIKFYDAQGAGQLVTGDLTEARTWTLPDSTGTLALTSSNITGTAAGLSSTLGPALGGTGIANNAANTITFTGNYGLGLTLSGATSLTLPTSGTLATLAGSESLTNKKLGSLTSNGFVKTSGGDGTLSVDTNTYLTSLAGAVLTDQTSGQTIGATGARLAKLWATDIEVTNAIAGSITGNAGTATALASNPTDCTGSTVATAIDASGNLTCSITPLVSANIDTVSELNTIITDGDFLTTTGKAADADTLDGHDTSYFQTALTYPVTGVASPTAGYLVKWGASGNTLADGLKFGTMTDGKGCGYSTANGLVCNFDYLTANQSITLSGDVSGSGQTSITTTIGNDKILEAHLKAVNAASDEDCLTYESTTGDFEWQSCSTGIAAADIDTSAELLAILTDETGTGLLVFNNSPTFADDITIHATGVKLTGDGDGALTILGLGDGYDEDLTLNLDDTENTLVLSSSTGLATIDIGTMALEIDEGKLADSTIVSADIKDGTITAADTAITAGRSLTWSTNDIVADAELYTDTKCIYFEDPTADDDFKSIWFAKQAATLTSIWCESDQTVNLDLQVDDGSPADVNGTDLVCDTTPPEATSLAGDATMASGDRLDLAITSVSGTPTWVSVCWTFEYSD